MMSIRDEDTGNSATGLTHDECMAKIKSMNDNGCVYCTDCIDCYNCEDCWNCTGCSDCYYCTDCDCCYNCDSCEKCCNCANCYHGHKQENVSGDVEHGTVGSDWESIWDD